MRIVKQDFDVVYEALQYKFPEALRKKYRKIILSAWHHQDEGGQKVISVDSGMYTLSEWSTSEGVIWKHSCSDREDFIEWVSRNVEWGV